LDSPTAIAGRWSAESVAEFTRFLIVGGTNTAISYGIYALGLALGLSYQLTSLLAIIVGIALGFVAHGIFVFRQRLRGRLPLFLGLWALLYFACIVLIGALSRAGLNDYVAGLVAFLPITGIAYQLQKRVVFSETIFNRWELAAGWLLALVAVARFDLVLRHELNWDEFLNLSMIYSHARGELAEVMQTAFVHLLRWVPYVSTNEADQIIAARLLMLAFVIVTSVAIFRITEIYSSRLGGLIATLAWNGFTFSMLHGSALRTDTISAAAMMSAVWVVLARRPNVSSSLIVGLMVGIGAAMTIKAIFYVPTIGALLLIRLIAKEDRRRHVGLILLSATATIGTLAAIYGMHAATFPSVASPSAFVARTSGATMFSGDYSNLINYLSASIVRNAGFWLLAIAGTVWACRFACHHHDRRKGLELMSFALPLMAFAIYRDVYPYFFPFILAPVAVLAGVGFASSTVLIRATAIALLAASAVTAYVQGQMRGNAHQRFTLAQIHKLFPQPVPYIDHTSMVSTYPKQGLFMSVWGMTDYRRRGKPIMKEIVTRKQPKFILVTRHLLDVENIDPAASQRSQLGLFAEDVEVLKYSYVRYWGPIYLPGLRMHGRGVASINVAGPYRLEVGSSVELAGSKIERGEVVQLGAGNYPFRADELALLRWAAPPPPSSPPPARLFDGF